MRAVLGVVLGLLLLGAYAPCPRQALRNEAYELAAQYLNALGPDRQLSAVEAARAVRSLIEECDDC